MTDQEQTPCLLTRRTVLGGGAAFAGMAMGILASASAAQAASYVRPVRDPSRYPITAQWRQPGRHWQLGYHTGVDIGCPVGTPVYATIGGDVRANRYWGSAYGTLLLINDNVDGSDWGYCHMSRVVVRDGQRVATNQLIGYSGATGNVTGPHLHLERRPRYGAYGSDRNPNLWP